MELNDAIINQLMMPGSKIPAYDDELEIAKKTLELNEQGIKARFSVSGDEQSNIGKVLDGGTIYYEDPRYPGKHIELEIVEDDIHYQLKDGSLSNREAYELHNVREGYEDELYSPRHRNPGSDAAKYQEALAKRQPLEEKYLSDIKEKLRMNQNYNRWISRW